MIKFRPTIGLTPEISISIFFLFLFIFYFFYFFFFFFFFFFFDEEPICLLFFVYFYILMFNNHIMKISEKNEQAELVENPLHDCSRFYYGKEKNHLIKK